MKYFDLVYKESIRLNLALANSRLQCYFVSSSLTEIIYGIGKNLVVFDYNPNNYEYGKSMVLKGLTVKLDGDSNRSYPVTQVLSFIQNNCNSFNDEDKVLSLAQLLNSYDLFVELSQKCTGWEDKYKNYLKVRYPW